MKALTKVTVAAGLLAIAGALAAAPLTAQRSGPEIWAQSCGSCHTIQPANRYTANQWETIVTNMQIAARLTDDEAEAILEFLKTGAKRVAEAEAAHDPSILARLASADVSFPLQAADGGAELYASQCAACHGKSGRGDGPAAVALNPRPPDLTNTEQMDKLTEDGLLEIISKGKGAMPGFGSVLQPEDLRALADYVRSLSKKQSR